MKGKSSIVSAIHHIRIAKEFFDDFCREHPGSTGARLFKGYSERLNFIYRDLKSQPIFYNAPDIREGISEQWQADVLGIVELYSQISKIPTEQREALIEVINHILNGEVLTVEQIGSPISNLTEPMEDGGNEGFPDEKK